jgi:hypothetical protein
MSLADHLRDLHRDCNPSCLVSRCEKEGCDLPLGSLENLICIDADRCGAFASNQKRPDYVLLETTEPRWIVVEMKSHTVKPGDIQEKFEKSARVLADDARFAVNQVRRLIPIMLHKGAYRQDLLKLQNTCILFRGQRYQIRVARCGTPISQILRHFHL